MKGALIEVSGNWGHFKKPETNNNPLTHDFITKTALVGMVGAVLGIERSDMRGLFPSLSDGLCCGVQVANPVKKESWAFKLRYATNLYEKRPVQMEFLKNPHFIIALGLRDEAVSEWFDQFINAVEASEAKFTPVLGLHNCPATPKFIQRGEFSTSDGEFQTKSFVTENHTLVNVARTENFRIGIDRMPTHQTADFWNLPDKYVRVFYPSEGRSITANGKHHEFTDGSKWALI